jgi:hypothetical protein
MKVTSGASLRKAAITAAEVLDRHAPKAISRFRVEFDWNCGGNHPPRHLAGPLDDPARERQQRPSALHREQ